ncbi:MAG: hypothetical protein US95_C0014G0008, partial [Candidatus Woesebacteria bacterium GW2011_GWB1_38_5]
MYSEMDVILIFLAIFSMFIFVCAVAAYFIFTHIKHRNREEESIDSVLLQVAVHKNNEIKIDAMEQLFSALYSIKEGGWKQKYKTQPVLSFEIVAKKENIRFYVWTPKKFQDMIAKQIHGAYPDADVIEVQEYNIFNEEGKVAYKTFQLARDNFFPMKSFKELPTDPMSVITSAMAKMGEGEAAAVQILISPAENLWSKSGSSFISSTKKQESDPEKAKYSVPAKTLEAIENKISKSGFETSIRIVVVSGNKESAKSHLSNIASAFAQFNGDLNYLKSRKVRQKGAFIEDFIYRYPPMFHLLGNKKTILNSEELASIYHFPNKSVTTPHIHWVYSKTAPAPAQVPETGTYLGLSSYQGIKRQVYISDEDRMRHMYIVGKTGVGKSELLKDLVIQDIRNGEGVCFIDPHGDAVEELLNLIPPERAEDVIYFNPSDSERPMGLNLLEANT